MLGPGLGIQCASSVSQLESFCLELASVLQDHRPGSIFFAVSVAAIIFQRLAHLCGPVALPTSFLAGEMEPDKVEYES